MTWGITGFFSSLGSFDYKIKVMGAGFRK